MGFMIVWPRVNTRNLLVGRHLEDGIRPAGGAFHLSIFCLFIPSKTCTAPPHTLAILP